MDFYEDYILLILSMLDKKDVMMWFCTFRVQKFGILKQPSTYKDSVLENLFVGHSAGENKK